MRHRNRMLIADLLEKGLDPKKAHSKLDKNGRLASPNQVKEEKVKKEKVAETTLPVLDEVEEVKLLEEVKQVEQEKVEEPVDVSVVASEPQTLHEPELVVVEEVKEVLPEEVETSPQQTIVKKTKEKKSSKKA